MLVQPLEINILCGRPWNEIIISPGKADILLRFEVFDHVHELL